MGFIVRPFILDDMRTGGAAGSKDIEISCRSIENRQFSQSAIRPVYDLKTGTPRTMVP